MDRKTDVQGPAEQPFTYKITVDNRVLIRWNNNQVTVLRGERAEKFLRDVAEPQIGPQLAMARATGNFKRGNERAGKEHKRNG